MNTKTARQDLATMRSNLVSHLSSLVLEYGKTSPDLMRRTLSPSEPPPVSIWSNGDVSYLITSASTRNDGSNLSLEADPSPVDEHWLNELPIEDLITIVAAFERDERTKA